jgi:hypothetical protein
MAPKRASRLGLSWVDAGWRRGRPQVKRALPTLSGHGVTEVPDSPLTGAAHAVNMASMLIRQKAGFKGDLIAHELRNLTGIRPYKI